MFLGRSFKKSDNEDVSDISEDSKSGDSLRT